MLAKQALSAECHLQLWHFIRRQRRAALRLLPGRHRPFTHDIDIAARHAARLVTRRATPARAEAASSRKIARPRLITGQTDCHEQPTMPRRQKCAAWLIDYGDYRELGMLFPLGQQL